MNTKISLIIFVSVLIVIMICLIINDSKENFFYQAKRFFENCENIQGELASRNFCLDQLKCGHNGKSGANGKCKNVCRFDPILCDLENLGSDENFKYSDKCVKEDNKYTNEYCNKKTTEESCEENLLEPGSKCSNLGKAQICKWNKKTEKCSVNECKDIKGKKNCNNNIHCFFVTDPEGRPGMCKSITGRDSETGPDLYKGEKKGLNAYNKCYNECTKWMTPGSDNYYSECNIVECNERCKIYSKNKKQDTPDKYKPYPTGVVSDKDYENIKREVMNKLSEEENDIFSEYIKKDYATLSNAEQNTEKLAQILKEINSVKSIGNDFIQQIDQIGNFQDKYSKHFNDILNNKNLEDPVDRKLERLSVRLKEVKNVFGENGVIDNLQKNIKNMPEYSEPYRQIISIDGQRINVTPVLFKRKTRMTGKSGALIEVFNSYKNKGPYLISTKSDSTTKESPSSYLYYGKTNREIQNKESGSGSETDKTGDGIEFYSNNSSYNWDLFYKEQSDDKDMPLEILDLDSTDSTLYNKSKNFYFFIKKISSREEYDYYLFQNSNDKLLKNVPKFPFYIIESVSRPGYLLNVSKASNGDGFLLSMNQAEGLASEKFNVGVIPASCD